MRILVTSIKMKSISLTGSLKLGQKRLKVPIRVMMQPIRKRLKRQTTTKRTFSIKKTIIYTEESCRYMQVNMKRHSKIWSKVLASCMPTKYYMKRTNSLIMKMNFLSLKTMQVRQAARLTFPMSDSVHSTSMSLRTILSYAIFVSKSTKKPSKNLITCLIPSQRSMQVNSGL